MHTTQVSSAPEGAADAVTEELSRLLARLGELSSPADASAPVRIDRIALLERVKSAAAAAQAAEIVEFAVAQAEQQIAAQVHPRLIGRGIADQIALACHISPTAGSQRLSLARALCFDLPATFSALRAGDTSEWVATLVSRETSHLDARARRLVDAELAPELSGLSPRKAAARARRLAYQIDPVAAVERARTEHDQRRVTLRPAPDAMAILTAYLPAPQAVATWAALGRLADAGVAVGDSRSHSQLMADHLVERVTGSSPTALNVEIGLLLPLETLAQHDSTRPAEITGYGPIPAELARDLLAHNQGRHFLRRLFTSPAGHIVDGDQHRRRFPPALAKLILARDQHCRDPFCDAPVRHIDHIIRHADNGSTTLTNGRGVCARGNYTRELSGWQVELVEDGLTEEPHTVSVTTPTGHSYTGSAPRAP